uniref:Uncharacterized protein n=1 Tax=Panagrolaimus sp. ES5 TaxID=591445 RepID=A0AC34FJS6_9BILA
MSEGYCSSDSSTSTDRTLANILFVLVTPDYERNDIFIFYQTALAFYLAYLTVCGIRIFTETNFVKYSEPSENDKSELIESENESDFISVNEIKELSVKELKELRKKKNTLQMVSLR